MKVQIAHDLDKARKITFQEPFPKKAICVHCDADARLGFVAHETIDEGTASVSSLYENKPKNMWLHDACAVAVYFCTYCLEPTAKYNQA